MTGRTTWHSPPSALALFTFMMLLAPVTNWEPHGVTLAGYCYAMRHGMKVQMVTQYVASHLQHYGVTVRGNVTIVYPLYYTSSVTRDILKRCCISFHNCRALFQAKYSWSVLPCRWSVIPFCGKRIHRTLKMRLLAAVKCCTEVNN
jgi:hypothetical protein